MNDSLFSIIVPCYNVQNYLKECVESILNQTFDDYELLLIDDGSTDDTGKICDELEKLSPHIKVRHKSNGGLSDARNYGMEHASGKYLVFVDSDDYIAKNSLSSFADAVIGDPDVIISSVMDAYSKEKICHEDWNSLKTIADFPEQAEAVQWIMLQSVNTWPVYKYVVSRWFIEKNQLQFKKGYLHEDVDWTSRLCMKAKTFAVNRNEWYYHRINREGSITNTVSAKRIVDVIEMADELVFGEEVKTLEEKISEIIIRRIMLSVYSTINLYPQIPEENKIEVINSIKKHRRLLKICPGVKYRIFSLAVRVLGLKTAMGFLRCLK